MQSQSQNLRILIVRLGAMGDILHAMPAVTALRTALPASWIGWAVEPQWTPLLCAASAAPAVVRGPEMPIADVLHLVPAKHWARNPLSIATLGQIRAVRRGLRAENYDICIDLQGAVRSAWIGRMASAQIVGEAQPREPLARWLFHRRVNTTGVHVIDQAREVVAAAVSEFLPETLPECAAALPFDAEAERWCDAWLNDRVIEKFIVLNPGAGWGAKRWPVDRYAVVAAELAKLGYAIVVNAGPHESALSDTICTGAKSRVFAMSGSIGQLIACTRRASLFIGGDTGPLHLAAALQVPVVGIYGPTDPARNGPHETPARILRHPASQRDHARRREPEAGLLTIT
ncbi:MAG: glycosyltransferase family 9 protein, partial [Acidobacteriaceae bacterium]